MATYWVRASGGNNGNDGLSYASAKATLTGALAAIGGTAGHTINVTNDGTHAMEAFPSTAITSAGTSHDSPGLVIQGTDSSGNPAMVTVAGAVGAVLWVRIDDLANYCTFKGIKFTYTALLSTAGAKNPMQFEGNVRTHRVQDCECWFTAGVGGAYTINTADAPQFPFYSGASSANAGEVEVSHCVVVNCRMYSAVLSSAGHNMHHNVLIFDADTSVSTTQLMAVGAGTPTAAHKYHHNTVVQIRRSTDVTRGRITAAFYDAATDRAVLQYYDNLIYSECGSGATSPGMATFILQGVTQAVSSGGSVGTNYLAVGPNLSAFIAAGWNNQTNGYSSYQLNHVWRGGDTAGWRGTDVSPTSVALTDVDFTDVFRSTDAYTWSPNDYDHVLPYDLRPVVGRTASSTSGVVGAIDDAIIVDVPPDVEDPDEETGRNYLDSYPFYKPLFKATTETMFKLRRNKVRNHVDMRHYLQEHVHDESMSRVVQIAASGVFTCGFGGVYRATGLLLETDQELSVVVSHYNGVDVSTFTVTVDQLLALSQCRVTQVVITNTSASTANVHVVAFD